MTLFLLAILWHFNHFIQHTILWLSITSFDILWHFLTTYTMTFLWQRELFEWSQLCLWHATVAEWRTRVWRGWDSNPWPFSTNYTMNFYNFLRHTILWLFFNMLYYDFLITSFNLLYSDLLITFSRYTMLCLFLTCYTMTFLSLHSKYYNMTFLLFCYYFDMVFYEFFSLFQQTIVTVST